jgi:tRNA (guanine6-N2)-methyltransferase
MNTYFATFVAGTQHIILRQLKKLPFDRLRVTYIDEGLIIFASTFPPERIIDFRFFNNVFILLSEVDATHPGRSLAALSLDVLYKAEVARLMHGRTPRVAVMKEGRPVTLEAAHQVEQRIAQAYNSGGSGVAQFWLVVRRTGKSLLGLRLARPPFKRVKHPAGALRPELVNVMCLLAGVGSKDVVLDPFVGYGSIVDECVQGFHVRQIIAVEASSTLAQDLQGRYPKGLVRVEYGSADRLDFLADRSVNKIVTDPPWGFHGSLSTQELSALYRGSLTEMARVLRPGGVAVLLSGNGELDTLAQKTDGLELIKTHNILVSGKKAMLLKLRKTAS